MLKSVPGEQEVEFQVQRTTNVQQYRSNGKFNVFDRLTKNLVNYFPNCEQLNSWKQLSLEEIQKAVVPSDRQSSLFFFFLTRHAALSQG